MTAYKKLIKPNNHKSHKDENKKAKWGEVLDKAWQIRSFEIEMFWKRSTYFSVLVGALFIAYYTIDKNELLKALIAILGFLASCTWFLSNKGSKFWQENWELHIDQIEKESNSNKIHSVVLNRLDKLWGLDAASYSVSKLNTLFSLIVCFSWLFVIANSLFPLDFIIIHQAKVVIGLVIIGLGCVLYYGKSKIKKSYNQSSMLPDGTITPMKQDIITVYHK